MNQKQEKLLSPKACILFWTRGNSRRILENPQELSKLDDDPALNDYATPLIKTIETLKKKGKKYNTLRSVFYTLRELNRNIDLMNPEAVKLYIADLKNDDQTKQKKANNYDYFVKETVYSGKNLDIVGTQRCR